MSSNEPENILEQLRRNWIFQLSLSSNELFHSNFLQALLADSDQSASDDKHVTTSWERAGLLAKWAGLTDWFEQCQREYGDCKVELRREWRNLDLAVVVKHYRGRAETIVLAIELKIKSFPTFKQAKRYRTDIDEFNMAKVGKGGQLKKPAAPVQAKLILLSLLAPPPEVAHLPHLTVMDFGMLADGMAEIVSREVRFAPALVEYIDCCRLLASLAAEWEKSLTAQTTLDGLRKSGARYGRMAPAWFKLCSAYLCMLVEQKMPSNGFDDIKLEIVPGFSRSTWSADFLWHLAPTGEATEVDRDAAVVKVGVQVEGTTIRFMMNAENIGERNDNPRDLVERKLLDVASKHGLYSQLHWLYSATHAGANSGELESVAFWHARKTFTSKEGMRPNLSIAKNKGVFTLTGFKNSAHFGHADYRLTFLPAVTLDQIADQVVGALQGEFCTGGKAGHIAVLRDKDLFASKLA